MKRFTIFLTLGLLCFFALPLQAQSDDIGWLTRSNRAAASASIRSATLTIASATSKNQDADYVCDGTADEVQINAAIQALSGIDGRVVMLEGIFYVPAETLISNATGNHNFVLEGQGPATVLMVPSGHATDLNIIRAEGEAELTNFSAWTAAAGWTYAAATGWTHSAGTTALFDDDSISFVVGKKYRVVVGYTWAGAGSSITITAGGKTIGGAAITSAANTVVMDDFIATATTKMTILPTNGFTGSIHYVEVTPALTNITFRNFRIDGNKGNVTGSAYNGININGARKVSIENVDISNGYGAGYGVVVQNSSDVDFFKTHFGPWGINGLELRTSVRVGLLKCAFDFSNLEVYSTCGQISFIDTTFNESNIAVGTYDAPHVIDGMLFNDCKVTCVVRHLGAVAGFQYVDKLIIHGTNFLAWAVPLQLSTGVTNPIITGNEFDSPNGGILLELGGSDGLLGSNKFFTRGSSTYAVSSAGTNPTNWTLRGNKYKVVGAQTYTYAIDLTTGTNIKITEEEFDGYHAAVWLQPTVTSATVLDNTYTNVTIPYHNGVVANKVNIELYGNANRRLYTVTKTYDEFAALGAASLTADMPIAVIPAKYKIVGIYCDTTTKFIGGGTTAATLIIGKSAGGGEYIAEHDVFTAAIVKGQADADMGTEMTRAAQIQGGALVDWASAITVYARLTTTTAHTDDLTQGSVTFYIETEAY